MDSWNIFTPRHAPDDTLAGHLLFALRYEGVDLAVLHALFKSVPASDIEALIKSERTGRYSRRLWFLYEWLTDRKLDIADATTGNYIEVLDPALQYPATATLSRRHRVRNNLPGTRNFCPLVRRTKKLETLINAQLNEKAKESLGTVHPDIVARAAAFLLLKDSKASYAIEGEKPPLNRAER